MVFLVGSRSTIFCGGIAAGSAYECKVCAWFREIFVLTLPYRFTPELNYHTERSEKTNRQSETWNRELHASKWIKMISWLKEKFQVIPQTVAVRGKKRTDPTLMQTYNLYVMHVYSIKSFHPLPEICIPHDTTEAHMHRKKGANAHQSKFSRSMMCCLKT